MALTIARIPAGLCRAPYPGESCPYRAQSRVVYEARCNHPHALSAKRDNLIRDDVRPRWCPVAETGDVITWTFGKGEE